MPTTEHIAAVVAAIKTFERNDGHGASNSDLDEATGLEPDVVDSILELLWSAGEIEGILTAGPRHPSLRGIRRVVRGRTRTWGLDGHYKRHP